jgi:DNA-binding XRE family transcriptional regulator
MTQEQVARAVGISTRNYRNIEAGTTKPNVETAISIAELLTTSVQDLFPPQRQLREDATNDNTPESGGEDGGVNVDAIPDLCRFVTDQPRMVTAAIDLADGQADTPEGMELEGLVRRLVG